MVQGKKASDLSNGSTKYRDQQSNMPFQRGSGGGAAKSESRPQNGNAAFRTDSAISSGKAQGERTLQRWVPDTPEDVDTSLESGRTKTSTGAVWDQFAENERRFGLTTDYDENIYTTTIDKSHPQYKQRVAEAEKKAREIERSTTNNAHVAEERITDNLSVNDNGLDEEDRYSGVRRQDFPPLAASNNRYTPPARRAPTGQATVAGAPVDPAIISSQLARPDKPAAEKSKAAPAAKPPRAETTTPPTTTESSSVATPDSKVATTASHASSPQPKPQDTPSAAATTASASTTTTAATSTTSTTTTATVEQAVASAFKGFAARERRNVDQIRSAKIKNDKEVKLNDLKKFADSFKLNTPVPSDLVSIIAKDPAKQKEIQEKAKRNAEEAKNASPDTSKTAAVTPDAKAAQRPVSAATGPSPSNAGPRQNNRSTGFQPPYSSQTYRDRPGQPQQPAPGQLNRTGLASRLRNAGDNKASPLINPIPTSLETKPPPTGPANPVDPGFSRRSSGVTSAQGARLNPNSTEFRPSPHAQSFSPNGNRSTGSSPKSSATLVDQQPSPAASRSLLKRKPVAEAERPSVGAKFDALEHIKSIKPVPEKKWDATGGLKPAYDTQPTWRQLANDEKPESTMHLTYTKLFEMAPFPPQTMSPSNPAHVVPQVPHQHQLPFHLQQGVHNLGPRQSPRQPAMNPQGGHHHGPSPPFNGADDHRMMSSHSAQSFASPRLQNAPMAFPSPMNQPAQLAYNPQMMPYPGAPPMPQYRSLSQSHQFIPQQAHMGPAIMMQNPAGGFMTSQGMAPAPQMMYPQGGQGHFMPPGNGHPQAMPVNGYPSPGRNAAPIMMSQGSQQGHQQPMYGINPGMNPGMSPGMNPGMSPGPQFGAVAPMFAQQQVPGQMPMRGYGGPNQLGTSPQQMHQFGPQQHRNNHPNGNFNNKNFQHGQHPNGPPNSQIPTGPQARASEGGEEAK